MTVKVPKGLPGLDTRGLPEGFDPHQLYEYRRETLIKNATGIESFLWKYIPFAFSKSFAFAIDPTAPFKVAPHRITPYNRHRTRSVASVLQLRQQHITNIQIGHDQNPNYGGISFCWDPLLTEIRSVLYDQTVAIIPQPPLVDESDDTTSRTRLVGSKQGTARFFKSYIVSPGRKVQQVVRQKWIYHPPPGFELSPLCSERGGTTNQRRDGVQTKTYDTAAPGALFFPNSLTTLREQEYAYLENLISKEAVSLFKSWSPDKRSSTLFRNIVELRDIPRSVVSLQQTLINLRSLYTSLARSPSLQKIVFDLRNTAKDIPNEYLSYHFGWKQTYKDIMELLVLPQTLSKKYEFLIKRATKPTTFRVKRDYVSSEGSGLPSFGYESDPIEYGIATSTRLERKTQLRLVINATFDFPPPNAISFKSGSMLDRMGLVPRPTDLYNLTPWTWLVDWFTGLGSYVEVIDQMNRDSSLINWGMITGHTTGRLITNRQSKVDSSSYISEDFVGDGTTYSTEVYNHESVLEYECQIRKDAATAFVVNTTAAPSLSGYQQSILGALLAQRKGSFTPRS